MELGTVEEVELIVDQIASNKIPPPNKAQSLVIIRQMVRMAKQVEAQAKEIDRLKGMVDEIQAARHVNREHDKLLVEIHKYKAICDLLGNALEIGWSPYYVSGVDAKVLAEEALAAWRATKCS